jgi:hypothetical protein
MSQPPPGAPAPGGQDLAAALAARDRGRARLRAVTVAAAAASLAATGVVLATLPGPAHQTGQQTASPAGSASRAAGSAGDDAAVSRDDDGADGESRPATRSRQAPIPQPAISPAHTSSGGS